MRQYIARRLVQGVFILFILSVAVFLLLRIAPGADAVDVRCRLGCREEQREAIRQELGVNDAYFVSVKGAWPFLDPRGSQYVDWVKGLFNGSLGRDVNGFAVSGELQRRLPVTAELLIITALATVTIGIPFGIISAAYRSSPVDYGVRFVAVLGLAVPNFWLATMVLIVPQDLWDYAPPLTETIGFFDSPKDNLLQFVPPAIVLSLVSVATVMRLTRSSMLEVLRTDYIRTARSKGLREMVVISRHALKNSMIPVVTVIGIQLAALFGGAVIIEQIFNLPGIGQYFLSSLFKKDFEVAQTLTLYIGVAVVSLNLLVDILYAWMDPRIRYS